MKRRRSDNLWWCMWWLAVAVFLGGWFCFLTGCGAKQETTRAEEHGRFERVYSQEMSVIGSAAVIRDQETGREYLFIKSGYSGGLTLMPEEDEQQTVEAVETVAESATVTEEPVDEAPELASMGDFKVTAYCSCEKCCGKSPDDPWYGITATGTRATEGRTIAVDPKVIPYGTVVYFEGPDGLVGGYVAEDCGGAINGNDIDLYFDSHADALAWGVREKEVFLYEE